MCDETTEKELDIYLKKQTTTRRGFNAGVAASMAMFMVACNGTKSNGYETTERAVLVPTPDGEDDGLFVHPAQGAHAAVIMWPDVHGVRPAFFDMARRLASAGYSVLAVNPYYRTFKGRLFPEGMSIRDEGGRDLVAPHRAALSLETINTDSQALTSWLDQQDAVDTKRGIGAVGFCMTGSWTLRAAASLPNRLKAPVSFHGGGLVRQSEDSPHRLAGKINGGVLIAIAQNDHERQPEAKDALIEAFKTAGVPAEIEVYEDAMHGWVPPDSRAYHHDQAERAWSRMLALFEAQLGAG